jgi:hypothetical protein
VDVAVQDYVHFAASCSCLSDATLLLGIGGHFTSGGAINRSRLVQLLVYLARDEEAAYKRRAVRVTAVLMLLFMLMFTRQHSRPTVARGMGCCS